MRLRDRLRRLPQAKPEQTGLGMSTLMDRSLAVEYGATYVHLAAFAIDIDRVYMLADEPRVNGDVLPFGWEVFVVEAYVLGALDMTNDTHRQLLEATCMTVLDEAPDEAPLGSEITFAVYDAVERGALPKELATIFHRWRNPLKPLQASLHNLWGDPQPALQRVAAYCLSVQLSPPLAPPTLAALREMAAGGWPLPRLTTPPAP